MYLIDTNIFLEVLLGQKNKEKCKSFLRRIYSGEKVVVTSFSLHSIIVIMESFGKTKELKQFLLSLLELKGMIIVYTRLEDEIKILELAGSKNLDFDDALQYYVAKLYKAEAIISYDRHFDDLDIRREEP